MIDCADGICSDPAIDVPIEKSIVHSDFNKKLLVSFNDIALVRLAYPVNFTSKIILYL